MTMMYQPNPIPAPTEEQGNQPFWEAAKKGQFLVKFCKSCKEPHWYPRTLCPFCFGETEWKEGSGKGTIYSLSVMQRGNPNPYCIAYVTLDEGVTMMTQIVDCDLAALKIGQRVKLVYKPTTEDGPPVPMFTPA